MRTSFKAERRLISGRDGNFVIEFFSYLPNHSADFDDLDGSNEFGEVRSCQSSVLLRQNSRSGTLRLLVITNQSHLCIRGTDTLVEFY